MITYRKITPVDADKFNALYKEIETQSDYMLYEAHERPTTNEQQRATLERLENIPETAIFVAEENENLLGFIAVISESPSKRKFQRYVAMGVLEQHHGKKIGQGLMEKCISFCKDQNVKRIELTVVCENEKAVNLYKKFGFEIEGTKRCSLMIRDRFLDEYYMSKIMQA